MQQGWRKGGCFGEDGQLIAQSSFKERSVEHSVNSREFYVQIDSTASTSQKGREPEAGDYIVDRNYMATENELCCYKGSCLWMKLMVFSLWPLVGFILLRRVSAHRTPAFLIIQTRSWLTQSQLPISSLLAFWLFLFRVRFRSGWGRSASSGKTHVEGECVCDLLVLHDVL